MKSDADMDATEGHKQDVSFTMISTRMRFNNTHKEEMNTFSLLLSCCCTSVRPTKTTRPSVVLPEVAYFPCLGFLKFFLLRFGFVSEIICKLWCRAIQTKLDLIWWYSTDLRVYFLLSVAKCCLKCTFNVALKYIKGLAWRAQTNSPTLFTRATTSIWLKKWKH